MPSAEKKSKSAHPSERKMASARVDEELFANLKAFAALSRRKVYEVVEEALKEYLERKGFTREKIIRG